ncbi:iron-sulfur cluster scaffold protein, mitochondrial-like [Planoprotostelium fungivorum]|uniref:Iron-sulfur cluster scaffold protein, mitochondrial-like n=1 Tax=Planoprotostelium fungivorum TaxID=1890364 RepID=A0A2P6NGC2_9EUKA|nr:iron-sulfur cluster scaffold protein, mitochondrial-like [Planoprotostelium fungivorum]
MLLRSLQGFRTVSLPPRTNWLSCRRGLFVTTQNTPNPDSIKFLPGVPVLSGNPSGPQTADFPSFRAAQSSPLAKSLFKVDGVKGVFLGSDFVTVTKDRNVEWPILRLHIYDTISAFFDSKEPLLTSDVGPSDTAIQPEDSEIVQMIKEILETKVRPSVQEDGGDIVFKGFEDGVVFLKMQGSCSGCPSSSVTLKNGIERMLMHWIPEVNGVVAAGDDELDAISKAQLEKTEESLKQQQ